VRSRYGLESVGAGAVPRRVGVVCRVSAFERDLLVMLVSRGNYFLRCEPAEDYPYWRQHEKARWASTAREVRKLVQYFEEHGDLPEMKR